ncbi:hypothetical protein BE04_01425 [Sorangium cellulosum]|uniref:Uncharacterized protein n=1 Tax=Sorangium cellulosum TaxID=56 RepID=A0A150PIK9_SORCE|nr:hypothetical protein BE04_01425 [Sorangium cellulosum]
MINLPRRALTPALPPLFWVVLWSSGGGCYDNPEPQVSGKAVVTLDGQELVIDTGDNGTKVVDLYDDGVSGACVVRREGEISVVVERDDKAGFWHINPMAQDGRPHVSVTIDADLYQGPCAITVEEQPTDIYEADVTAGPCDAIRLFDGAKVRLETATFHVRDCLGTK